LIAGLSDGAGPHHPDLLGRVDTVLFHEPATTLEYDYTFFNCFAVDDLRRENVLAQRNHLGDLFEDPERLSAHLRDCHADARRTNVDNGNGTYTSCHRGVASGTCKT
jgi:hypothetical protein